MKLWIGVVILIVIIILLTIIIALVKNKNKSKNKPNIQEFLNETLRFPIYETLVQKVFMDCEQLNRKDLDEETRGKIQSRLEQVRELYASQTKEPNEPKE